jgi:hypothetical protein
MAADGENDTTLANAIACCEPAAMADLTEIADQIPLPTPPAGWFDYSYTPLMDGRLALIRTQRDFHTEYRQWMQAVSSGDHSSPAPDVQGSDLRLSIFDGVTETEVTTIPPVRFPVVDRMADGRWIVASGRASLGAKNGRFFTADGVGQDAIVIGDGIEDLLCSPDGTFWVGYFDEGIFGGPNPDGSWPASSGGIVQFSSAGQNLWSFNDQVGSVHPVDDAYAITLFGSTLWACYQSDFPIARVEDGKVSFWSNTIAGARAIAVEDDIVLLAGGYGRDDGKIAVLKLEGDASRVIGTLRLEPVSQGPAILTGRGGILHSINESIWTRLSASRAARAVEA